MKFFAIILAVYFLGLNFMSCDDAEVDKNEVITEFSHATDLDHDYPANDICSPFCHCHCCHTHTIDVDLVIFEPFQPLTTPLSTLHFDSRGKDYQSSLLQPPRQQFI